MKKKKLIQAKFFFSFLFSCYKRNSVYKTDPRGCDNIYFFFFLVFFFSSPKISVVNEFAHRHDSFTSSDVTCVKAFLLFFWSSFFFSSSLLLRIFFSIHISSCCFFLLTGERERFFLKGRLRGGWVGEKKQHILCDPTNIGDLRGGR